MNKVWNVYRRIGTNAISKFGRFVYTLQFAIIGEKQLRHRTEQIEQDLVLMPCQHGRVVGAFPDDFVTRHDFRNVDFNEELFHETFASWGNKHGSGIRLVSIKSVQIQIVKAPIAVAAASTWFEVPNVKTTCVNVMNDDNGCFQWALLSALCYNSVDDSDRRYTIAYEQFIDNYNWEGIVYTDKGADYTQACKKFEEINPLMDNLAINVWKRIRNDSGTWDSFPVHLSGNCMKPNASQIDLFLAEDEESDKCHYLFIRDLSSFVHYKKGDWPEICRCCLQQFKTKNELADHACYPTTAPKVTVYYANPSDSKGFLNYHNVIVPSSFFVVAHAISTKNHDNELKISQIAYKLYTDNIALPEGIESEYVFDSVHDFMDIMTTLQQILCEDNTPACKTAMEIVKSKNKRFHIIVNETKVLHQIVTALDDYGVDLGDQFGIVNDTDMSCLKIGALQFIDSTRFFETKLKGEDIMADLNTLYSKWTEFRQFSIKNYKLDPANFHTLPALAWNAVMLYNDVKPEYITNRDIYTFLERAKRGGINIIPNRRHQANNPLLGDAYDPTKETTYLANFDIKSSYGYSMKQHLPYGDYKDETWYVTSQLTTISQYRQWILSLADDADTGYFFEVTLSVPPNVHWQDRHSDLPFAPTQRTIDGRTRLYLDFLKKEKYVVHYRLLKYYLRKGMILETIHGAVSFTQKQWLKPFMELQEKLRNEASDEMDSVVKLITNSLFGRSIMNKLKEPETKTFRVDTVEGRRAFNRSGIDERTVMVRQLTPSIIASSKIKKYVRKDQLVGLGTTILDLGKLQLYEWYYDKLIPRTVGTKLLYCDTDSLIVKMNSDPKELVQQYPEYFNGAVGSLKNEDGDSTGVLFIGSKAKHYAYDTLEASKIRIAGLAKEASKKLNAGAFIDVLDHGALPQTTMNITYTRQHVVTMEEQTRSYLDDIDHTRQYLDQYTSKPFGYIGLIK